VRLRLRLDSSLIDEKRGYLLIFVKSSSRCDFGDGIWIRDRWQSQLPSGFHSLKGLAFCYPVLLSRTKAHIKKALESSRSPLLAHSHLPYLFGKSSSSLFSTSQQQSDTISLKRLLLALKHSNLTLQDEVLLHDRHHSGRHRRLGKCRKPPRLQRWRSLL
jgi:hypothetical protein